MKKLKKHIIAGLIAFWGFIAGITLEPAKYEHVHAAQDEPINHHAIRKPNINIEDDISFKHKSSFSHKISLDDRISLDNRITISDGIFLDDGISISDGIFLDDGISISDGIFLDDGISIKNNGLIEINDDDVPLNELPSENASLDDNSLNAISSETASSKTSSSAHPCIIREAGVSDSDYQLALSLYDNLPSSVKTMLQDSGWHIVLSETSLKSRMHLNYSILGTTVYTEKRIYLDHRTKAITSSFYHEIGHVIAYQNDQADIDDAFVNIYFAEKDSIIDVHETGDHYGASCCSEFFATIVDDILTSGDTYAYSAPQAFSYVNNYLQ